MKVAQTGFGFSDLKSFCRWIPTLDGQLKLMPRPWTLIPELKPEKSSAFGVALHVLAAFFGQGILKRLRAGLSGAPGKAALPATKKTPLEFLRASQSFRVSICFSPERERGGPGARRALTALYAGGEEEEKRREGSSPASLRPCTRRSDGPPWRRCPRRERELSRKVLAPPTRDQATRRELMHHLKQEVRSVRKSRISRRRRRFLLACFGSGELLAVTATPWQRPVGSPELPTSSCEVEEDKPVRYRSQHGRTCHGKRRIRSDDI